MSFVATTALTEVWAKVKALFGALEDELDGKADASHAHSASDVTSGTLDAARIPSLAASKIGSGTLDIERIPTGTTSSKVALGYHVHDASNITSGTLSAAYGGTGQDSAAKARAYLGNPPMGSCSTANGTVAKVVALNGFALYNGVRVLVSFVYAQTSAQALTLNVNSTGAKIVYVNGVATGTSNPLKWRAAAVLEFVYFSDRWYFSGFAGGYSANFYIAPMPTFHFPSLAASTKPSESDMPVLPCRVLLGDGSEWLYS